MGFFKKLTAPFGGEGGAAMELIAPGTATGAGLLGLGAKVGPPDLQKAELDPDAAAILDERSKNFSKPAGEYEQQIADEQNRGVGSAGSLLSAGNIESPMKDALRQRQEKQFMSQASQMRRSDLADAPGIRGQRMASTVGAIRNDSLNALNFAQKNRVAQQNKTFARNNAINAVFKSVGTGVGAVLGAYFGGPEGMKAGAVAGQGIGGLAGSASNGPGGQLTYLNGSTGG